MHPLTRIFALLSRSNFTLAVEREHLTTKEQVNWYPVWMYELMETDENRNAPYRKTIQEVVAGKIVLELGTGRKAFWAAQCSAAGAKKVYAVEANRWAYEQSVQYLKGRKIDNIHPICGYSNQITLPERCEVLVHDLIGNIASSEGMIPFIEDAKRRLLTPDAVHIPRRCVTYVVLAEDPTLTVAERTLSSLLRRFKRIDRLPFLRVFGYRMRDALSEPAVFEDFNFCQEQPFQRSVRLNIEIKRDGLLRGVFFFLRLHFTEATMLDTWACRTSWEQPFIRFKRPVQVRKGDRVELSIDTDLSEVASYSLRMDRIVNESIERVGEYAWQGD